MLGCFTTLLAALLLAAGPVPDIAASIANLGDGSLGLTYEVRDGVTGDGHSVRVKMGPNSTASFCRGYYTDAHKRLDDGPAYLRMRVRSGKVVRLNVVVGGAGKQARESDLYLGEVAPTAVVEWLMDLVPEGGRKVAEEAVLAAAIARDHGDPRLRRTALFALTQFEGNEEVVALLEEILTE